MSVSSISKTIQIRLWGKAAGRCQYDGCNEPLWQDNITKTEFNIAYIAHIIADKPNGPRGHKSLSANLKSDSSNLMLLCDRHHRLIDKEDVKRHSVKLLKRMKSDHEKRIELLTSITKDKQSHVVLYGANIGQHYAQASWDKAAQAMIPNQYPAEKPAIELSLKNSSFHDHENNYWQIEKEHLNRQFREKIKPRIKLGAIQHVSIFALAPQPLLIELGRLFSDMPSAEIYQLHREHPNWIWQKNPKQFQYRISTPRKIKKIAAINLSLSAQIKPSRITNILGENVSIWTITINRPNNDFLKSKEQLSSFRTHFRVLLDRIKAEHGENTSLHIFPATPVAIAIEIGRVWMPKADLPFIIYDQNRKNGGFEKIFEIKT